MVVSLHLPPGEDGRHLAARVRAAGGRPVPILVYDRGHMGETLGVQAILDLGANAYVADPTSKELLERVAKLCAARPAATGERDAAGAEAEPEQVVAQGELATGRVAELVHAAWARRLTGILLLVEGAVERRIHFLEGAPIGHSASSRAYSLVRWLVDHAVIDDSQYQAVIDTMARDGLSQAAALVATGVVDAGEPLYDLLRAHAREAIRNAFQARHGRWRMVESRSRALEVPALELPPLVLIREGARHAFPLRFFREALGTKLGDYPRRSARFRPLVNEIRLDGPEMAFALKLDGRVRARDLATGSGSRMRDALILLWFLDLVGALEWSEDPVGADEGPYRSIAGSRKKKALPPETAQSLREEVGEALRGSYFRALGVEIDAGEEAVESAYQEKATRFHPDTWVEYELGELEPLMLQALEKVSAARRILLHAEKRRAYLEHVLSRHAASSRRSALDVDAEVEVRRGERAMKEKDWATAVAAFTRAVSLNPREPEYYCMLAFATFEHGTGPAKERAKQPRKLLKKAAALAPDLDQPHVILGILEHACGNPKAARRHLLTALRKNPDSITAKAALRRVNEVDEES
ncbi:MAG: molecular chaperone DnaJ [Deltaproteobacteria bacterium]|nr:MAG: molecular chaperone DnaJ [Deltaproteobacteria bacterium]